MRVAVAGGTGTVGRLLVEALRRAGHEPAVLARSTGVDLRGDSGVAQALDGVEVIIDVTNAPGTRRSVASAFFRDVTGRVQALGAAQGVRGLVTLSIVGLERAAGYGYYAAKLEQERVALGGPVPAAVLRATQFHEFPAQILRRSRVGPVGLMPVMAVQPVAARSVAAELVALAEGELSGQTVCVAGPEPAELVALARRLVRSRGRTVALLPLPIPGAAGKAIRSGALLAQEADQARIVGPGFAEWLTSGDARDLVI